MILDSLERAHRYLDLHPLFPDAFSFLRAQQAPYPTNLELQTPANTRCIFMQFAGQSVEQSLASFECHNQHIDIQVVLQGTETFGWKARQNCLLPTAPYDAATDLQLFQDAPATFFDLPAGHFVIFFPDDVHAPMIGQGNIGKCVVKIPVA